MKCVKLFSIILTAVGMAGCNEAVNFASSPVHQKEIACQGGEAVCNAKSVTENFTAPNASGKADILFVMDGGPTTALTVTMMAERIKGFEAALNGVDWQIAITNAGMGRLDASSFSVGDLLTLTPNLNLPDSQDPMTVITPSLSEDFLLGNLNFHFVEWGGNEGSYCEEEPFCTTVPEPMHELATLMANHGDALSKGFFRPGAVLVPIIITAQEENGGHPKVQPADVVNAYQANLASTMAGLRAYSVIIQPGDSACLTEYSNLLRYGTGGEYGTLLDQFAKSTGGKSISICQSSYVPDLSDIPKKLAPTVTTITLKQTPIQGSVQIQSVPAAPLNYSVQGNVVTFSQALTPGTRLSITYLVEVSQD